MLRIAHISDLHTLDLTGARPWHFLNKRLLGGINLLRKRRNRHPRWILDVLMQDLVREQPDHLVVTGDLTNLSLPSEFAAARGLLDGLSLGPSRISVVPGNHDVYVLSALLRRSFARAMGAYCTGDAGDGGEADWPFVRVRGPLAVIGCSTALPSPPPLADGWLGSAQITRILAALTRLRGTFRVLALHHPPLPGRMDVLRALRDRHALRQVIAQAGCELILHGHEHRDIQESVLGPVGPIPVIGVGSASHLDPRPERRARYNLYTLTPAASTPSGFALMQECRVLSSDGQRFVRHTETAIALAGSLPATDTGPSHLHR